jgi:hypothetical protein
MVSQLLVHTLDRGPRIVVVRWSNTRSWPIELVAECQCLTAIPDNVFDMKIPHFQNKY